MPKKKVTIENLARMIEKGFQQTASQNDIIKLEKRITALEKIASDQDKGIKGLIQGQEDIKIRLGQIAFRFELEELEKRVRKIELQVGSKKT